MLSPDLIRWGTCMLPEADDMAESFEIRRKVRDRRLRSKMDAELTPGLPIDGDAPSGRVKVRTAGSLMQQIVDGLLVEKSPFFDEICAKWNEMFPDSIARPGRFQNGRVFLYVRTSGQLFALRSSLREFRRKLSALASAPKRFSVHLEIHA